MIWKKGDRFTYIRMCGGWGNGTVLEVRNDLLPGVTVVVGRLDCQKEGETYRFNANDPRFVKGELKND